MNMNLSKLWEIGKDRGAWSAAVHGAGNKEWQYLVTERIQHPTQHGHSGQTFDLSREVVASILPPQLLFQFVM